jgi:ketosteroid isomerase-like protein
MSAKQQTDPDWVQRYVDAWNSHDGAAVGGFFADEGVYTEVTLVERLEGPDAVREFVDGIANSFSSDYSFRSAKWSSLRRGFPSSGRCRERMTELTRSGDCQAQVSATSSRESTLGDYGAARFSSSRATGIWRTT